jgi:hypothetical protein
MSEPGGFLLQQRQRDLGYRNMIMQMMTHSLPLFLHRQPVGRCWLLLRRLSLLIGLALFLGSCSTGGESGDLSEQPTPRPQDAQQAIENLRDLYRTALRQEDIDRLQELFQPQEMARQQQLPQPAQAEEILDLEDFRQAFRTSTITALDYCRRTLRADLLSPRLPRDGGLTHQHCASV